jgi:hypothetical protein
MSETLITAAIWVGVLMVGYGMMLLAIHIDEWITARKEKRSQGVPMKPNPLYLETKSRRLQLLIKPSLHAKLRARATAQDMSLNELIHSILEQYALVSAWLIRKTDDD